MTIFDWNDLTLAERRRVLIQFFNVQDIPLDVSPEMEWEALPRWLTRELTHL